MSKQYVKNYIDMTTGNQNIETGQCFSFVYVYLFNLFYISQARLSKQQTPWLELCSSRHCCDYSARRLPGLSTDSEWTTGVVNGHEMFTSRDETNHRLVNPITGQVNVNALLAGFPLWLMSTDTVLQTLFTLPLKSWTQPRFTPRIPPFFVSGTLVRPYVFIMPKAEIGRRQHRASVVTVVQISLSTQ